MNGVGRSLAVVIPTLDEANRLPDLIGDLAALDAEIIVVDGGSRDGTPTLAEKLGVRVLETASGRGHQLRAGAASTDTEWIFFVHADCRVGATAIAELESFLAHADEDEFAHYRFALDGVERVHRVIEFGQRVRERCLGLCYGDQGLIVSRTLYDRVSGYPEWPIMEDVGLVDRLREQGQRTVLPANIMTSARRYESEGLLFGWIRNASLLALFRMGIPASRLARWYRPHEKVPDACVVASAQTPRRVVIVFAKAPTPGKVKTRLAKAIGTKEAVRIYRSLGREIIDSLRGGPYRLLVYVDPPGRDTVLAMDEWLGRQRNEYRPQSEGGLGVRMTEAFAECLQDADEACIVGTDILNIDQSTVQAAFDALTHNDVVFGPAMDGGYYLVAMRAPHPRLFEGIPWSTENVLTETLARASEDGVRVTLLEPKTDVDTLADVPAELLAG